MSTQPDPRDELRQAVLANNELYRTGQITRKQWTATNRELAEKGKPYGMTLPEFALTDAVLEPGTLVQYRKVGKGRVVRHACPALYDGRCPCSSHVYAVQFETGRYRKDGPVNIWLDDSDVIKEV